MKKPQHRNIYSVSAGGGGLTFDLLQCCSAVPRILQVYNSRAVLVVFQGDSSPRADISVAPPHTLTHSSLFLSAFGSQTMNDAITDFKRTMSQSLVQYPL